MTVRIGICILTIVAFAGTVRAAVPQKGSNTATQTNTGKVTASPATKQSAVASGPAKAAGTGGAQSQKPSTKKNAVAAKPTRPAVAKESPKQETSEAAAESGEGAAAKPAGIRVLRGQRDPFETVIRSQPEGPGCAAGKKCLIVEKMDLKGVVRSQNGMIAIITTDQRKTYFLHENDPVYNGHVVKINPDSIVFRETVTDRVGRQSTREVVKRITRPAA